VIPSIETTESLTNEHLQRLQERGLRVYTDALLALTGRDLAGREISAEERHAALERSADTWNRGGKDTVHEMLLETGRRERSEGGE